MSGYISNKYNENTTALTLLSDAVCDCAVGALGAYVITRHALTVGRPDLFIMQAAGTALHQSMLSYTLDGIFKKHAQFLSPMLATAFCGGLALTAGTQLAKITLSDDVRFNALSALGMLIITKGLTRRAFNTGIYPSLKPLVQIPASGIEALFNAAVGTKNYVVNSRIVQGAANKVSWLWHRWSQNPCGVEDLREKIV